MITPQDVLQFWFQELNPQMRFAKNAQLDQKIHDRFLETHRLVSSSKTKDWRTSAEGRLAEIIVLDQFSRNMFRDSAKAFESDALALKLAQEAVALGEDKKLSVEQRAFMYMPYMHSEDKLVHEQAVKLFSLPGLEYNLKFEYLHKKSLIALEDIRIAIRF